MFFALYTLGEQDDVLIEPFENQLTPNFGYVLFGMFHISNITILMSMLIAMMTKSFDTIIVIVVFIYIFVLKTEGEISFRKKIAVQSRIRTRSGSFRGPSFTWSL